MHRKAAELHPHSAEVHGRLGNALMVSGQNMEAVQAYVWVTGAQWASGRRIDGMGVFYAFLSLNHVHLSVCV